VHAAAQGQHAAHAHARGARLVEAAQRMRSALEDADAASDA
jgi:hypothetical protein